mmetsp:Transcript_7824/g.11438  ORF Transcript_7824/g.11438 Transcript_7824/m.11438 type:complete len:125 (-) Transcript_7824:50-424(-)
MISESNFDATLFDAFDANYKRDIVSIENAAKKDKLCAVTVRIKSSITAGVTCMSFPQSLNCLDMLLEQVLVLLRGVVGVQMVLREEAIMLKGVSSEAGSTDTSKLEGIEEVEGATTSSSSDVPP